MKKNADRNAFLEKMQFSFTYHDELLQADFTDYSLSMADTDFSARYSINKYPYNSVPLIEFTVKGQSSFGVCSGVVVGPHTVLTASHGMFPGGKTADNWELFMRYSQNHYPDPDSPASVDGRSRIHYYNVGRDGTMTRAESEWDYAVINTKHKFNSWFGIMTEYGGGKAHMTGYPSTLHGVQQDTRGSVDRNSNYDVLDYLNFHAVGGNSGGPIWVDRDPGKGVEPYVVGLCSTTSWATLITNDVLKQIRAWVKQDGYSFGRQAEQDHGRKVLAASEDDQFDFAAPAPANDNDGPIELDFGLPAIDDVASILAGF